MSNETATAFVLPEGFKLETITTKVGDVEYPLSYPVGTTLNAWRAYWESRSLNVEDTILKYLNEIQTQRATQGNKGPVRDAAPEQDEAGNVVKDLETVRAEAIAKHQARAAKFLLGKPRETAVGGVTKKTQAEFGTAVVTAMTAKGAMLNQAELAELAKEYGIDPSAI